MKILTKLELYKISERIEEIDKIVDLCDENDSDVLFNLEKELENYIQILKFSLELKRKSKFKLVY